MTASLQQILDRDRVLQADFTLQRPSTKLCPTITGETQTICSFARNDEQEHSNRGRLSGPIRPYDAENLASPNLERYIIYSYNGTICLAQVFHLNNHAIVHLSSSPVCRQPSPGLP